MPGFVPQESAPSGGEHIGNGSAGGPGGSEGNEINFHPLLIALLKKISDASKGRCFWTFAMNVSQIYDADEAEPVEMKLDIETKGPTKAA
jgi:hypothetical protein